MIDEIFGSGKVRPAAQKIRVYVIMLHMADLNPCLCASPVEIKGLNEPDSIFSIVNHPIMRSDGHDAMPAQPMQHRRQCSNYIRQTANFDEGSAFRRDKDYIHGWLALTWSKPDVIDVGIDFVHLIQFIRQPSIRLAALQRLRQRFK